MCEGLVYVVCQQSGPDPEDVARKYFNGDVPNAEAHYRYTTSAGIDIPEVLSLYVVTNPKSIAEFVNKTPLPQGVIDIRVYELFRSWGNTEDKPVPNERTAAVSLSPTGDLVAACDKWYEVEHVDLLSKVPGWKSSRRYRLLAGNGPTYLALHAYVLEPEIALDSFDEFKAAVSTDDAKKIVGTLRETPNAYERREWTYSRTHPICPKALPDKFRKFVSEFYKISDSPGAHEDYANNLTDDAWVGFNGKRTSSRENILKLRQEMWTRIIKRHHRPDKVYMSTDDELAIYGSSYFTGADGTKFPNKFWARMKFEDPSAEKLKLVLYEVNKREPLVEQTYD